MRHLPLRVNDAKLLSAGSKLCALYLGGLQLCCVSLYQQLLLASGPGDLLSMRLRNCGRVHFDRHAQWSSRWKRRCPAGFCRRRATALLRGMRRGCDSCAISRRIQGPLVRRAGIPSVLQRGCGCWRRKCRLDLFGCGILPCG